MNLAAKLKERAEQGRPVRVRLIGAGKFGTVFLAQARLTPGLQVAGVADLSLSRALEGCEMEALFAPLPEKPVCPC